MNQSCKHLLCKLLNSWQRSPDRERATRLPITQQRAPQYFQAVLPELKEALHAGLQEAEAARTVKLEWGKGYDSHILKRITLLDGPRLGQHLGVSLAATKADQARESLEAMLSGDESWIREFVEYILDRWRCNRPAAGMLPGDMGAALLLVQALEAVAAGRHRNLDLRTFSTREFGNSKAMEGILSRFGAVWKRYHPSDLATDELLNTLGLVKFPLPLLLRGDVILELAGRNVDCSGILPFVGLPPQSIRGLAITKIPDFVLTIENLASFNRYAAEVQDEGLVIYTAGFPAPGVADFLRLLDSQLPEQIPFYHWGDIDEGGLKIFAYIQEHLQRLLRPHLMDSDLLKRHGTTKTTIRRDEVSNIASKHPCTEGLALAILSTVPPKVLEQENIDPLAPGIEDIK
ncbi:Wadjet anti-phage system protein JetD domain-containing protein [Pelotalea chapellei]|uniref:Wadjet protein JetD C-terminal domain-containing protein n=1 Tax=Pelotalea chapellei TaxID=44671 RepID=A0ABS5U4V1_9BACT|nr:Wadjet anti-phage system protein JetD domain-containing protein [Pelotalea chapellei]MBT1070677.1 hypothetical protein [Pelotalea chapellei]